MGLSARPGTGCGRPSEHQFGLPETRKGLLTLRPVIVDS